MTAFGGGVVFIQYDIDVTPILMDKMGVSIGDCIAQLIVTRINNNAGLAHIGPAVQTVFLATLPGRKVSRAQPHPAALPIGDPPLAERQSFIDQDTPQAGLCPQPMRSELRDQMHVFRKGCCCHGTRRERKAL